MLLSLSNQMFFDYASDDAIAAGPVSSSLLRSATEEPPPWPLVIVLPLITGLSMSLWVGIGKLLGSLLHNRLWERRDDVFWCVSVLTAVEPVAQSPLGTS